MVQNNMSKAKLIEQIIIIEFPNIITATTPLSNSIHLKGLDICIQVDRIDCETPELLKNRIFNELRDYKIESLEKMYFKLI